LLWQSDSNLVFTTTYTVAKFAYELARVLSATQIYGSDLHFAFQRLQEQADCQEEREPAISAHDQLVFENKDISSDHVVE
jgi:hypothetical protein